MSKSSDPVRVAKLIQQFPQWLLSASAKRMAITLELHRHHGKAHPDLTNYVWLGEKELRNLNTPDNPDPAAKVTPEQRRAIKSQIAELVDVGYIEDIVTMVKTKPWCGMRKVIKLAPQSTDQIRYNKIKPPAAWPSAVVANRAAKVKHEAMVVDSQMGKIISDLTTWPALPLWDMPKLQTELRERTRGAADGYLAGGASVFVDETGRTVNNTSSLAGHDNTGLNLIHVATFETHTMNRVKPWAVASLGSNPNEQILLLMIWLYAIPVPKESKHLPPLTVFDVKIWATILDIHPKTIRQAIKKLQNAGKLFVVKDGRGAQAVGILTRAITCTPSAVTKKSFVSDQGKINSALAHVEFTSKFTFNPTNGLGFAKQPQTLREHMTATKNKATLKILVLKQKHQIAIDKAVAQKAKLMEQLDDLAVAAAKPIDAMTAMAKTMKAMTDMAAFNAKKSKPDRYAGCSPQMAEWLDSLQDDPHAI